MAGHIARGEGAARPQPHKPTPQRMLWLDWSTGVGLDFEGRPVEPIMDSRRKNVRLVDLLETARRFQMDTIMLCGQEPQGWAWLHPTAAMGSGLEAMEKFLPGWEDDGSYHGPPARGRFVHTETGFKVQAMLASEWLTRQCPPHLALWTYDRVTEVVAEAIGRPDWPLMRNPAATGLNIWKLKAPSSYTMEAMDPTIGALIQATEPQHRIESFIAADRCPCGDCIPLVDAAEIPGFCYADGRFMFHAVPKALGAAPAFMMDAAEATQLQHDEPFWPARYRVRVTMSEFWDGPGLFPVKQDEGLGWHYPNRPGCTFETWVDSDELRVGLASDGVDELEILEGIRLTKTNSLDFFVNTISRMLELCDKLVEGGQPVSPMGKKAVADVIKHMYRATIGSMARRQRYTSHMAADASQIPADARDLVKTDTGWSYKTLSKTNPRDWETWHPEIAARVWGASRARMLDTPVAKSLLDQHAAIGTDGKRRVRKYGLLQLDPEILLGIQGDAIYTTQPLTWTFPEEHGGGDDGKDGRIRIKGYLPGPMPCPQDRRERQILSDHAEHHGWEDALE